MKIPWVRQDLCGQRVLVMEWIDGIRCTDPAAIRASGLDMREFIRSGVVTGLRQLLEVRALPPHNLAFAVLQCICPGVEEFIRSGVVTGLRQLLEVRVLPRTTLFLQCWSTNALE